MEKVKLQLALDVLSLHEVIEICEKVKKYVDIFEAGTLLCLSEGIKSIEKLKMKFPGHKILANIRIIKAGKVLSDLVYSHGADIVTLMSDSDEETIKAVCEKALYYDREIQIEINNNFSEEQLKIWKKYNINKVIMHRHSELKDIDSKFNFKNFISLIEELGKNGFETGITGGIKAQNIKLFKGLKISSFIIGREIIKAENPEKTAEYFKKEIEKYWKL